ncbi:MAG TPA: tRNA epoxyqueuosine(34) reductase QueG [Tepidisphaeraceae bacterium]|jgi:epoxyqueuosine reductase|nr:tRNA epoxyqueuosine(34) reductase QueG [Tepidisphaeraceae bacterium]
MAIPLPPTHDSVSTSNEKVPSNVTNATAIPDISAAAMALRIKAAAREIGFDLVGIASAEPSRHRDFFRRWLDDGHAGSMHYMGKRFDERVDPGVYFPGAASVVCVAMNYHVPLGEPALEDHGTTGRVARYALGSDYHKLIKSHLHALADRIRELSPAAQTRAAVDTAPVMERELAERAGIGWIGKNTCIIHPRIGSWILLGQVITTLALPPDDPVGDHCGSCTRCIDACPTQAITSAYTLDARRCISYLTIEHRDEISRELHEKIGDWLYGCDVCQDVCPHNRQAPSAIEPALQPRFAAGSLNAAEVARWTDQDYRDMLGGSAMKRAKLPMLKRNAEIVKANSAARVTDAKE